MHLRRYRNSDLEAVSKLWEKYYKEEFSLPSLFPEIIEAVIEDDWGEIVGFGVVKVFAEAVMILDKDRTTRERVETLDLLMDFAVDGVRAANLKQLHVFVSDGNFGNILKKHYEFKEPELKVLVKEIK